MIIYLIVRVKHHKTQTQQNTPQLCIAQNVQNFHPASDQVPPQSRQSRSVSCRFGLAQSRPFNLSPTIPLFEYIYILNLTSHEWIVTGVLDSCVKKCYCQEIKKIKSWSNRVQSRCARKFTLFGSVDDIKGKCTKCSEAYSFVDNFTTQMWLINKY